jgi:hypothetical protein
MFQEIFALTDVRSAKFANQFLDLFLGKFDSLADDYPIPEHGTDTQSTFGKLNEILEYLERTPTESYSLYFATADANSPVFQAMLFFTSDAKLIIGVAVNSAHAKDFSLRLKKIANTEYVIFGDESPPPPTSSEFVELCAMRKNLKEYNPFYEDGK